MNNHGEAKHWSESVSVLGGYLAIFTAPFGQMLTVYNITCYNCQVDFTVRKLDINWAKCPACHAVNKRPTN